MSKVLSKKTTDETQSDNYRAGFNYGRLARAGINAFRELVIAWRTGNLKANRLLSLKKQKSMAITDDVINTPAVFRKNNLSFHEWGKQNHPDFPKSVKHIRYYDIGKTLEILAEDSFGSLVPKNHDDYLLFENDENHAICGIH